MSASAACRLSPLDQAHTLRTMIEEQAASPGPGSVLRSRCRTIAVVSGKGGVGKSVVALNLAVNLAQRGASVCLVDANAGLGNLDLMCGLNGYWNVSHVVTGARELREIVLTGPAGIELMPGASSLADLAECPVPVRRNLVEQLCAWERRHDVLVIDTGSGGDRVARQFALAADQLLVVTTPEPTSITDAYATIKSFCPTEVELGVVVNQTESSELAIKIGERLQQTSRTFLRTEIEFFGGIPRDPAVPQSIRVREPLAVQGGASPAGRALSRLASRWESRGWERPASDAYFARLTRSLPRGA